MKGVRSSTQALLQLSNDVLDLGRIESGRLSIVSSEFDLAILIEAVGDLV